MMKTIIVDDEPKAIALIRSYLTHFADFELVSTFRNGLKALEFLNKNQVNVVFLDINMPHLNGLSLSKMIPKETAVVFTTAYSEHAVESYTINAVDYLLKPISLERFSKTIIKINQQFENYKASVTSSNPDQIIFVKSGPQTHKINVEDILFLEKDGNYIYYVTAERRVMVRSTVQEALEKLPISFIRVQKSFIVNFKKIEIIETDHVVIRKTKIPIGPQYKAALVERLKRYH